MTAGKDPTEGEIERRKREHVELATAQPDASGGSAGFEDVQLVHQALPETAPTEIDPSTVLLGRRLGLPLVISAMTGGYGDGELINARLARAAQAHNLAMGVGSQRAALVQPDLARTYATTRAEAPDALLIANIGVAQLVDQADAPALDPARIEDLIGMIRADALAIHLNATQELIQPEGQPDARGWLGAIEATARAVAVPVIAKETGAGLSSAAATRLRGAGVAALDVGGRGGTSFGSIEAARADQRGDRRGKLLGALLSEWGTPTLASVALARRAGLPVIATGGVRNGLHAAKAIAMGATAVGVARPLLEAALAGDDAVNEWIGDFRTGLVAAMYLTGSRDLATLAQAPRIVTGESRQWIEQLEGLSGE